MPFPPWQSVPHTTKLQNLFSTSLMVHEHQAASGILLRCSPGLEEGSATIVLATTRRPNALGMIGVDDETQIGYQAQALLGSDRVHVVAVPHITWKSLGNGLPWRTPIAVATALLIALLTYLPPLSWSPWAAVPLAAVLGMVAWLLLRERHPTRIGPPEAAPMTADDVVKRVIPPVNTGPRRRASDARLPKGSRRWAPER